MKIISILILCSIFLLLSFIAVFIVREALAGETNFELLTSEECSICKLPVDMVKKNYISIK